MADLVFEVLDCTLTKYTITTIFQFSKDKRKYKFNSRVLLLEP